MNMRSHLVTADLPVHGHLTVDYQMCTTVQFCGKRLEEHERGKEREREREREREVVIYSLVSEL